MARFQIFLAVLLFALQIAGHAQDFDIASQGIVVAGPDAIVGDVLVRFRQDGNNLVLEFRGQLRDRRRKHFCGGRWRRDRLMRDIGAAEHDIHIEQAFAIQRFGDLVAGLLHQGLFFFRERGALFSSDDEKSVRPIFVPQGHRKHRFRARGDQAEANGAPVLLIA